MKAVAINGSPRAGGNTEIMLRKVLEQLEAAGRNSFIHPRSFGIVSSILSVNIFPPTPPENCGKSPDLAFFDLRHDKFGGNGYRDTINNRRCAR